MIPKLIDKFNCFLVLNQKCLSRMAIFCLGLYLALGLGYVFPRAAPAQSTEAPVEIVQATANPNILMEQAANYYAASQYSLAEETWQDVITILNPTTQRLQMARSRSNLALSQQELGKWEAAELNINLALEGLGISRNSSQIQPTSSEIAYLRVLAQSLDIRGKYYFLVGNTAQALTDWQSSQSLYEQISDARGYLRNHLNQAQAYQVLGQYLEAKRLLAEVTALLPEHAKSGCGRFDRAEIPAFIKNIPLDLDEIFQARAWWQLGKAALLLGRLDDSICYLKYAETKANVLDIGSQAGLALDKGHTYRAIAIKARDLGQDLNSDFKHQNPVVDALTAYQNAAQLVSNATPNLPFYMEVIQLQALANQISMKATFAPKDASAIQHLLVETDASIVNINNIEETLGRDAIYAQVFIAESLLKLAEFNSENLDTSESLPELDKAIQLLNSLMATNYPISDQRAESYVRGRLAQAYFQRYKYTNGLADYQKSEALNQQATALSIAANARDIQYQWHYQLGHMLEAKGDREAALSAYKSAVTLLESVRSGLLLLSPDFRYSFRDSIEPVYRDLVSLLLTEDNNIKDLSDSIQIIESLHIAEIENFLQCRLADQIQIDTDLNTLDANAILVYPIILKDRLEIVFKISNQPLQHVSILDADESLVTETLRNFRNSITSTKFSATREPSTVYQWLIEPIIPFVEHPITPKQANTIETLVFIPDGLFRNIPIAALYDSINEEFLVEKEYALAVLPSTRLFQVEPLPFEQINVFGAGISERTRVEEFDKSFEPLNAEEELDVVSAQVPTSIALNKQFTRESLQDAVQSERFSVVHLVTHGKFSAEPEETYVLASDELLTVDLLDQLLKINQLDDFEAIQLLVLSACETASGDDRAVLGLAGLSVRAGARSTLATLWQVRDGSAIKFAEEFYRRLQEDNVSKARALHLAQQSLRNDRNYQDPSKWAAFVLVGNWL